MTGQWFPALALFVVGCVFAAQLVRAATVKEISIPLQFLVFEERDLESRPAEFWGIVVLNSICLAAAWSGSIYLLVR